MKLDMKDEKTRTIVLGAAAVLMVAILALRTLTGGAPDEVLPSREHGKKNGVSQVKIAVIGHDLETLKKLYKPILDADPFKARLFVKKKGGSGKPGDPTGVAPTGSDAVVAGMLALRLTGIFAVDSGGLTGFFENRNAGKGLFVQKGDRLGASAVSEVRTDSILLVAAITTETTVAPATSSVISLGDRLDILVKDAGPGFKDIGPVMSTTAPGSPGGSSSSSANSWAKPTDVKLTDTERDSVLERLKKKRQASLGGEKPGGS